MSNTRRWTLGLAVLVLVAYVGFARRPVAPESAVEPVEADATVSADASGSAASWLDIPASTVAFETLEGSTASVQDYRGRVVLLNFWATWCLPCRREIPELVRIQQQYSGRGATVIGVAVESGEPAEIREFLKPYGADYPIWVSNTQKPLTHYNVIGYPFTLLIDGAGRIRKQYLGPQSFESLARDIESFLPPPGAAGL
ncbi:MAG: TlpA disulfide reductase family protein [Gemmatimonadota bacterium]